jgi:D-serine deaminase-like pyridoxal phosphate-dependent protein
MRLDQLTTPALLVDVAMFAANVDAMAAARPGPALRPHVKAFKSTAMARAVRDRGGHRAFCCATIREMEGMASAGLGDDLLLANEVVDARRLGALVEAGNARLTVAVDSPATIEAAASAGVPEVLIDVNIGLPRCGCAPEQAGELAERARARGLEVRGVMGYEGHVVGRPDRAEREVALREAEQLLRLAWDDVGGPVCSGGGTGTYDLNELATEIQAGSYLLMDTAYDQLELPFGRALSVLATVISQGTSRGRRYQVCDAGLKALGMDQGNPAIDGAKVWFCSDEHTTFAVAGDGEPALGARAGAGDRDGPLDAPVGGRVRLWPAHVDPTVAYHDTLWLVDGDEVVERWPVDLRGW